MVAGEKRLEAGMVWVNRPCTYKHVPLFMGLCSARTTHELPTNWLGPITIHPSSTLLYVLSDGKSMTRSCRSLVQVGQEQYA